MEREKVIELANAKGIYIGRDSDTVVCSLSQLQEFTRLVEQETLERAAQVCDDAAERAITSAQESSCTFCADSIRNLKDNHDKE